MEEAETIPASHWVGACRFDTPEEAYLKKEAAEERKKALTEKQREVYVMRYEMGLSQEETAIRLGISPKGVQYRMDGAIKKLRKIV